MICGIHTINLHSMTPLFDEDWSHYFHVCCILTCKLIHHLPIPFSGRGGICPYNDACGPQLDRNRLFPVFHWLYDQRDCWYRHCWAGCGILPDPGNWQGMFVHVQILLSNTPPQYSSHYVQAFAMECWFMINDFAHELKMEMVWCTFCSAATALHISWRAEKRTPPRTSRVLHH